MSRPVRLLTALVLAVAGLSALGGSTGGAAAADGMFRPMGHFVPTGDKVRVKPASYSAVRVDLAAARARLRNAPSAAARSALVFEVPTPTGGTERFALHRTRVMAPGLAAAHPEIQTYAGHSLDSLHTTIALDITPMGLHAAVRGPAGTDQWYVDPAYDRRNTSVHLSYYRGALPSVEEDFVERHAPEIRRQMKARAQKARVGGQKVTQKVYRLAFVSDPSYAAYFGSENVLAEKATLINRVNQVYNADLAIKLELIEETDELNFDNEADATGPNGPCGAHPCFDQATEDFPGHLDFCWIGTLGRNRIVLGQLVGASNYDVGHIGLGVNGGGIAYLGVVGADYKGGGCTGLPEPKGDFFAIDYVAHELGHQFDARHTYSACGGDGNGPSGVEPGSGSTVMAYAGICGPDDLQPHTDPYFSGATVDEINGYTNGGHPPVVEVQTVSLEDFGPGDTLTFTYDGDSDSLTYEEYSPLTIETILEDLGEEDGLDVTVADWGYDPFFYENPHEPPNPADFDETGFQVIFAGTPFPDDPAITDAQDHPMLEVSGTGVVATAGETAQGGAAKNGGHEKVATGNRSPKVKAPADKTIPARTPFKLVASATDADGHKPTLVWEQLDWTDQPTPLTSNAKRFGPLFRMFGEIAHVSYEDSLLTPAPGQNRATRNGIRFFPDLPQVLANNTNAKTGKCRPFQPKDPANPGPVPVKLVDCYSEFLPTAGYRGTPGRGRALHFRVTARDGYKDGGGLGYDTVTLRVNPKAGPFLVKSFRKAGGSVKGGSRYVVKWQVKGTRKLAKRVQVLISYNGGKNWKNLVRRTPNDGKVKLRIPKHRTKNARLMVRAVGNYFYDVNDRPFRIR